MKLQNNTNYEITLEDYMQLIIKIDGVDQVFECREEFYAHLPQLFPETLEEAEDLRMDLVTDAYRINLEIEGEILFPAVAWFGEERLMEDWDWDAATMIIDDIIDTSW